MPRMRLVQKRVVPTLVSLSTEKVARNLGIYFDSLSYLPVLIKAALLRKVLRSSSTWRKLPVNKTLAALIYPSLKQLDLTSVSVDDETVNLLRQCRELAHLILRTGDCPTLSTNGLKTLFTHTAHLQILDVSFCKCFNDEALQALASHCTDVRELCVEGCDINNTGLVSFALTNKKLTCLNISSTKVDGEGISQAVTDRNWPGLLELRVDNCEKVDDEILKTIIQNCPKIEILTFFNCCITGLHAMGFCNENVRNSRSNFVVPRHYENMQEVEADPLDNHLVGRSKSLSSLLIA